jgi:hypothetical protein
MKSDIKTFVASCSVCVQDKPNRVCGTRLLSPLSVPTNGWQVISMDFIEGLPTSAHANCIMAIVDKFSKFDHFVPLHHPFSVQKVAQAFMDNIF